MKYILTRSSCWSDLDPRVIENIPNAKKEILTYYIPKTPDEDYNKRHNLPWEEQKEAYTVEINSLEELHNLMKDLDEDIIIFLPRPNLCNFRLPKIEIYDSWRE